jgi:acyl carrier protein
MDAVAETIRDFILSNCLPGESRENLAADTPLVTSGILDSLALMNLVDFLERTFGIEMSVYDTTVERFDRIVDIAAGVIRKRELTSAAVTIGQ